MIGCKGGDIPVIRFAEFDAVKIRQQREQFPRLGPRLVAADDKPLGVRRDMTLRYF